MKQYQHLLKQLSTLTPLEKGFRTFFFSAKTPQDCQNLCRNIGIEYLSFSPQNEQEILHLFHHHMNSDSFLSHQMGQRKLLLALYPRYFPAVLHSHDCCVLFYVLKGHCFHHIHGRTLPMTEGMFCFVAPHSEHALEVNSDDSIVVNFYIPSDQFYAMFMEQLHQVNPVSRFFTEILFSGQHHTHYLLFDTKKDPFLKKQILSMLEEQQIQDNYSSAMLLHMLNIFFIHLLRNHADTAALENEMPMDTLALDMIFYIHKNLQSISLPDLAARYGYSEAHCSRLLKQATGYTYVELVRSVRVKQAATLLSDTDLSITDIGFSVGYENAETFIRAFKKEFHITPSQFRLHPISSTDTLQTSDVICPGALASSFSSVLPATDQPR